MYIVTLTDGTTYNVDADTYFEATNIIKSKLRNRNDYRTIKDAQEIKGVKLDKNSEYYNGRDTNKLKCTSGWSYKWR